MWSVGFPSGTTPPACRGSPWPGRCAGPTVVGSGDDRTGMYMIKKPLIRRLVGVGVVAVTASTAGVTSLAAQASSAPSHQPKVIASGLNSPRQLAFSPSGSLYVAEAGTTGNTACRPSPLDPDGGPRPASASPDRSPASARRIRQRVVTGLPSVGSPADALGPADLVFTGKDTFALTTGLGGSPEIGPAWTPGPRPRQVAEGRAQGLRQGARDDDRRPRALRAPQEPRRHRHRQRPDGSIRRSRLHRLRWQLRERGPRTSRTWPCSHLC